MTAKLDLPEKLVGVALSERRYRVLSVLGEGSMAYVYKAYDNRLDTNVVIKVPKPAQLKNADFMIRFRRESQLMVRLTNPHVVQILDVGEYEELPFVVMQFLAGGTLKDRITPQDSQSGCLPTESLKGWIREVARALDFVHTQNIVHRDVKPANILFDKTGNAFLSDFGLTKIMYGDHRDQNSEMTAAGFIVGTPNYVAPEIILGMTYDGRADQYSLGITVYHAMFGSAPMQGASSSATMVNQTQKELPLLSDIRRDFPLEAALSVKRAISKQPMERFDTCEEFADSILDTIHSVSGSSGRNRSLKSGPQRNQRRDRSSESPASFDMNSELKLPPRKKGGQSGSSSKVSKGTPGAVPCPKCRIVLPLKEMHSGRRGRCIHCNVSLLVSSDLTTLTRVFSQQGKNAGVSVAGSNNKSSASDEMFFGEKLFFWNLSKKTAMGLALGLLALLIGITIFLTMYLNQESTEEALRRRIDEKENMERN